MSASSSSKARKRKPETVARVAAALEAHLVRHPKDRQSERHLSKVLQ